MGHIGDAVSATPVWRRRFEDGRFDDRPFGDGCFGDGLQINVVSSKFLNLPTVSTLLNCSRKISTVGIHGQGGQENLSDVQRKSSLGI